MSTERDPETDQRLPIPNDQVSCQDLVIADMEERKKLGLRKYGTLLQPFNGRSFLQDAYEEVLDLAVYLRGKLEEEKQIEVKHEELVHLFDANQLHLLICKCDIPKRWTNEHGTVVCLNCMYKIQENS